MEGGYGGRAVLSCPGDSCSGPVSPAHRTLWGLPMQLRAPLLAQGFRGRGTETVNADRVLSSPWLPPGEPGMGLSGARTAKGVGGVEAARCLEPGSIWSSGDKRGAQVPQQLLARSTSLAC